MIGTFIALLALAASPALAVDILPRFIEIKESQYRELAAGHGTNVSQTVEKFFTAVTNGDRIAAASLLQRMDNHENASDFLYPVLHETFGAFAESAIWEPTLLDNYARDMLASIPDGAVFFGGTSPGRFIVTAYSEALGKSNTLVVTQNGMTDRRYVEYLRVAMGDRLVIPSKEEFEIAMKDFRDDIPQSIWACRSQLARMLFDHNNAARDFYVEESFVITWMYPLMEPHGLVMKLNREPAPLTPGAIKKDRKFWTDRIASLSSDAGFATNEPARRAYSKLRSGFGGMYEARGELEVAEHAYRESVTLCPECPEPNFRLSDLMLRQFRFADVIQLMRDFRARSSEPGKIDDYIKKIELAEKQDVRRRELEPLADNGADADASLELLAIYNAMGMRRDFDKLFMSVLGQNDLSSESIDSLAKLCHDAKRPDLYSLVAAKKSRIRP